VSPFEKLTNDRLGPKGVCARESGNHARSLCFWLRTHVHRYPADMLKRSLPALLIGLSWTAIAHANPAAPSATADPPAPAPAVEEVDVEESLRAARRELVALLAKETATEDRGPEKNVPAIRLGAPPSSMTSYVPARPPMPSGATPDLAWLRGLRMPDIPIRWDDRLVRLLDYYRTDPRGRAHMRGLLARQGTYDTMIRAKLRAQQMPEDLVYLAMVESAFDPKARSDVGATGIWQLMAAAATQYGLEVSRWVDTRMSPEPCTDAALKFLKDLYDDLGSWPLALAAFNMGEGALLRAIQKYNTNDFWLLTNLEAGLPFETVGYVTKIMAFAIIGENRARFGVGDVVPEKSVETAVVELPGGLSLTKIARAAGVNVATLSALNPELKKSRLPPDVKLWPVRLPKEKYAHFREKWAHQGPLMPPHREHVLRFGERLSDVAELYSTTSAKLLKLNDLPDDASLRPGDKLLVPDVEPVVKPLAERPVVGIPADSFVYADRKRVFYRVAEGDELGEIARFFRVTPDELRMWNRVSTDAKLQRGMYLQLYVPRGTELTQALVLAPNQVRTLVVGSEEFFNFHESQQNRVRLRYRVKPGDTLRSLAERFDLSVGSIARINQFPREKKLEVDSEIIIYVDPNKQPRTARN
jgi:membrane-bound lytic murein transglycosylase D